jgi:hypothetical protein
MCITCGCKAPEDNHGNPKNITLSQFRDAAQAAGTDLQGVNKNVQEGLRQFGQQGQGAEAQRRG